MSQVGYSLSALEHEFIELQKDYVAFVEANSAMQKRLLASVEVRPPRSPELHTWSGSRAVMGALEMAIHSIERTMHEYDALILKVRRGELPNVDAPARPALTLIKGDE